MVDFEIVREWLDKAQEDFEFAKLNLEGRKSFYAHVCFHFQQSAEKHLKAFIIARELRFRKIHDLDLLRKICQEADSSFEQLKEDCQFLNTYYVESRYPVHWPARFTLQEAQRACEAAERVRRLVREKLRIP